MRACGALFLMMLGTSAAIAQGDPRGDYGPVKGAAEAKVASPAGKTEAKNKATAKAKTAGKKEAAKPADGAEQAAPAADKSKPAKSTKNTKTAKNADKPATNGSANPTTPAPKPSGLADTYAAIPLADRMAIQNDLAWGGDYSGPIDGQYSERLVEAAKSYQKRHKGAATGVLSDDERAALASAVAPRKDAVGWRLAEDPATGARLGVPEKLAPKTSTSPSGTRWSSGQGQLQIETFRIDTGATLDAVFEQQKKMPRRRVASSAMQADSFAITGMQGLKKMVVRGYARDGEVRGITILYDQAMEGTVDPLVTPMTSAFVPFAGVALAGASDAARRKVEYGTGIVVSAAGYVLTSRALIDSCNVIALPGLGNAERVATDPGGELALVRVYGARNLAPIGLIGAPSGDAVTLVGIADPQTQSGGAQASTVSTQLGAAAATGTRPLSVVPALGFSGAAALDAEGKVSGLVVLKSPVVAGPAAAGAPRAAVVPAERIKNFLEASYVAPASGPAGIEATKASLTRVICVRK
jgi:peptidoglycan hydrolase-like protein with peptidoglycan-binding domain